MSLDIKKMKKDCIYFLPNFYCSKKKTTLIVTNHCKGCKEYTVKKEKKKKGTDEI